MRIAMVETATETPLKFWSLAEGVTEVRTKFVTDGLRVSPVCLGWANETHAVLEVTPFAVPEGKVTVGQPSYAMQNGKLVETYAVEDAPPAPEPERPMVRKSVVQQRLIEAGKMETAYAMLTAQPVYFARWFAPDHPSVYCDDPDAMGMVMALQEDPAVILAPEAN